MYRLQLKMLIGARLISVVGHPSSVRAYGPATFPVGEGFLRRGLLVLSDLKNYGIATTVCALSRNDSLVF